MNLSKDTQAVVQGQGLILGRQFINSDRIRLSPAQGHFIEVNEKRYRGLVELSASTAKKHFMVINIVGVEDYLKGVVPNEMHCSWPLEALKAQAVAARTFAFYQMSSRENSPFDMEAGTNSQVYQGMDSEQPTTTEAVEGTRNIVAVFNNKLISAFYHSNCGGHTANVKDVWGGQIKYLYGGKCGFCDAGPHYSWKCELSEAELVRILTRHNLLVTEIRKLELDGCNSDGRVARIRLVHSQGVKVLKAPVFRMMVGPERIKSTCFEVRNDNHVFVFGGRGWGHGVGLCQEGAFGMANAGYRFDAILHYYYKGVELRRMEL